MDPRLPVWVKVGKLQGKVLYAGTAPGLVNGVLQVNVQLPEDLSARDSGAHPVGGGAEPQPPGTFIAVR